MNRKHLWKFLCALVLMGGTLFYGWADDVNQPGSQQRSSDIQLRDAGELVQSDQQETTTAMVLGSDISGRILVRDSTEELVAEVKKTEGNPITINLPPGFYTITVNKQGKVLRSNIVLVEGEKTEVLPYSFVEVDPQAPPEEEVQEPQEPPEQTQPSQEPQEPPEQAQPSPPPETVSRGVSINLIEQVDRIEGFSLSAVSFVNGPVIGVQLPFFFGFANGAVKGAQISNWFVINSGELAYFQVSGIFNINDGDLKGGQASGVANINGGEILGAQASGAFNISGKELQGIQASGVFNINGGGVKGCQASGVFNIAGGAFQGVQASSIINVSGDLTGAQFGILNIASDVRGAQVGLVNISKNLQGVAVGLLNFAGNGLYHPMFWVDMNGVGYLGFQLGTDFFYTLFQGGTTLGDFGSVYAGGIGFGFHIPVHRFYLEVDLSAKNTLQEGEEYEIIIDGDDVTYGPDGRAVEQNISYPSLRTVAGFSIFDHLGVFCGGVFDMEMEGEFGEDAFRSDATFAIKGANRSLLIHPRFFLGVKF